MLGMLSNICFHPADSSCDLSQTSRDEETEQTHGSATEFKGVVRAEQAADCEHLRGSITGRVRYAAALGSNLRKPSSQP
jgi:hypothetical protein